MKMYSIGIDIGASHSSCGLYNKNTNKLELKKYILNNIDESLDFDTSTMNFINTIKKLLNSFIKNNKINIKDVSSIGIGCPGGVDKEKGIFFGSKIMRLNEINWKLELKEYNLNVFIENDCNCAAICENHINKHNRFIMFSIGTDVGISFLENGKCMDEIVWDSIKINKIDNTNKRYIRSFHNLAEQYNEIKKSRYKRGEFFKFVKQGEKLALNVLKSYVDSFIEGVKRIQSKYDVKQIVIGGGISEYAEFFLENMKRGLPDCDIKITKHKNDSGIIGAALLEKA